MKILGIETSCDETGIAILEYGQHLRDTKILSNLVSSQVEIHKPWGGVVPNLARREHSKHLVPLIIRALKQSKLAQKKFRWRPNSQELKIIKETLKKEKILSKKIKRLITRFKKPEIDLIAVTIGPGLEPALWVGANLALTLSKIWQIPIVEVDHIEAHLTANWLIKEKIPTEWPAIALVVSGGHTELVFMEKLGSYQIIGQTRDDAAGECFDKTARVLGLDYPGGPAISKAAEEWIKLDRLNVDQEIKEISLPRPMMQTNDYDFSFSGLKTAVLYQHKKFPEKISNQPEYKLKMADEIQNAINDVLIHKTIKAAKEHQAKTILLGGGVSANKSLRQRLETESQKNNLMFFVPPIHFCTDNAAIIALNGIIHSKKANLSDTIKVNANLNLNNG
jgi:N6-L-threonylcarbamoyladenine synthase